MKVYIDGDYYDKNNAKISVYDHGLLYGDGVFEGIRIYNGAPFLLDRHLDRLYDSAQAIHLAIPLSYTELRAAILESVSRDSRDVPGTSGYIRLVITRGVGDLGLDPGKCRVPSVIIIVDDISLYPDEYYETGISVISASVRRAAADMVNPRIKSLNYLNNILAKIEARQSGAFEAVILNSHGCIAECTGDNLFIVKNGVVYTPSLASGALSGITREFVISLVHEQTDREVRECALTQYDLYTADECFLTGSAAEIMPVVTADGRILGDGTPGEITKKLEKLFRISKN